MCRGLGGVRLYSPDPYGTACVPGTALEYNIYACACTGLTLTLFRLLSLLRLGLGLLPRASLFFEESSDESTRRYFKVLYFRDTAIHTKL